MSHLINIFADISSRLTPQPSGSTSSIAKSEIGRSITSILGNSSSSSSSNNNSTEISGAGPSTSALPPIQQVPLVRQCTPPRVFGEDMRENPWSECQNLTSTFVYSMLQSLKKESDWERSEEKESASDFRHPSMADLVSGLPQGHDFYVSPSNFYAIFVVLGLNCNLYKLSKIQSFACEKLSSSNDRKSDRGNVFHSVKRHKISSS